MDHLQIIADALRLVIEQSHVGSRYQVNAKDDGGTRHVTDSREGVAKYLAEAIRMDRQSMAIRQTLDQQQIDLLEDRLSAHSVDPMDLKGLPDPGGVVNVSDMALSAASAEAKAHRQDRLDLLEDFKRGIRHDN